MNKHKVLIVEDEILVAETIRQSLLRHGYAVAAMAVTGEEAIRLAEIYTPDVVIMDIALKDEMDGIQAASTINMRRATPVIFLTAHASMDMFNRAKIIERFVYISKPFKDRQILSAIETLTNGNLSAGHTAEC